ncbi:hypothetical protein SALBM311S_02471 [Streptomyces alboniger]
MAVRGAADDRHLEGEAGGDHPHAGGGRAHINPVLVVGAGPVGLSAALALRAHELPVVLLEADPKDRERPGSRALFVHRETLRLLDGMQPGLAEEITGYGRTWQTRRTLDRGREVYSRTYPPSSGTPPFTTCARWTPSASCGPPASGPGWSSCGTPA